MDQSPDDPNIDDQVRAEQVRTLYGQSAPVLLANVLNAGIVCYALWSHASHTLLISWAGTMTFMVVVRILMRKRYWAQDDRTPADQETWGLRFTIGSLCAGLLWGFAGGVLMPDSLPHEVLIVFVIGGMGAGAAASIACYMPAYFAYLIPSLVPAVIRLWSFGGDEQIVMIAMLVLFIGALTFVARNVNRALTQAFRFRFENGQLYLLVSRQQAALVRANERLIRANEELESRVQLRTNELRASQAQLFEIVSESPDAIVVFEEDGHVASVNPAAERISGRTANALLGKHFAALEALGPEDLKRAVEGFASLLAGEERSPEEFRVIRPDGETVVVEMKMRLVESLDGKRRIHTVIRDVTERHRLQRLKEAYERRLREAERLESVGMLAGGVAHDFNNVLTMIMANVDLVERWTDRAEVKARLGEIRHGSLQAANLTKQLLSFSRRQLLDVQPTDLSHVVTHARTMFERALGEQNRFSITLPTEPMVVLVDATQIEQAILNLLVNARHALPNGGRVDLELRRVELASDADWPDTDPGAYIRIAVSDDGLGMDEATRSRVFEPFFTTRELGHGTGLGLSSVHGLIKQARGYIRVTSELGEGSRFEILLPCHTKPAPAVSKGEVAVWSPGTGTVLLVEDQAQVRNSLQRILEDAGYEVIATEDGQQALEVVRKREGRIDLLVSDVIMPGLSGIELSRRLLALYPNLAVLLVSGYAGTEITRLTELGENVQFLQKPFDAVSFTSAAQTALQSAQSLSRRNQPANLTN
ncbi:MAG TPA: PAS domain S-box protein [Polyangiales bacterium]|nr:PAS domain S-box protein [Polyangiales bacterium]